MYHCLMKPYQAALFVCILSLAACTGIKKLHTVLLPAFDKEGHRGCRGLMPENTIAAMLHAVSLGVTTLEMDASITKDGAVILSHEPFFNHEITTKPDGRYLEEKEEKQYNIHAMTYAQTQQYDVGMKPNPRFPLQQKMPAHKPLLADVIDSVEAYCSKHKLPHPWYNIETKTKPATDNVYHPAPDAFVQTLMKVIMQKGITDRVVIQSFDFRTLQIVHRLFPGVKTSMLIEAYDKRPLETQVRALGFTPDIYSPENTLVNPELVKACHAINMKVVPWTVNTLERIRELTGMGVDGIITDFPDLYSKL